LLKISYTYKNIKGVYNEKVHYIIALSIIMVVSFINASEDDEKKKL